MTSALSSTHFSAALPQLQAGFGFPPYLYHGSFTNCVKKDHGWHLEQGVCAFPCAFFALLGVASNCGHQCYGSEVFRALPLQSMETRACFLAQQQIQKPSLYFSVPFMALHAPRTLLLQKLTRPKCYQGPRAMLWRCWSLLLIF